MTIYLDNAATTFPKPEPVYAALDHYARNIGAGAGRAGHDRAEKGADLVDKFRRLTADLVNAGDPTRVILTKNATESLNLAILGLLGDGDTVVCTDADHNSVLRPLSFLEETRAVKVIRVPCDPSGGIDLAALFAEIEKGPKLVVTTHASNVTGAITDILEVAARCAKHGALLGLDCAQTAGSIPIDMTTGIDFVALTGHKSLFGPTGTGALVLSERIADLPGQVFGGTGTVSESDAHPQILPHRLEAGTSNTFGLAGLVAGIEFVNETGIDAIHEKTNTLRKKLIDGLQAIDRLTLFGAEAQQATSAIAFKDERLGPSEFAFLLNMKYGIQVRAGLHCAPLMHKSLGTWPEGAIRLSPGYFTTEEEIDQTVTAIEQIVANT
jgi:cysteine desulfurase / selenocysteine lyase